MLKKHNTKAEKICLNLSLTTEGTCKLSNSVLPLSEKLTSQIHMDYTDLQISVLNLSLGKWEFVQEVQTQTWFRNSEVLWNKL